MVVKAFLPVIARQAGITEIYEMETAQCIKKFVFMVYLMYN